MTKETRLRIARFQYMKGNYDHPHVQEFNQQITAELAEPEPVKPKKKRKRKK